MATKYRHRDLRIGVIIWLLLVGAMNISDGVAFILVPEVVSSTAYDWARVILPGQAWGWIFLSLGVSSWSMIWLKHREIIRALMIAQVVVFSVFGISIFGRTLAGQAAAFTGANKWMGYSALGLWLLSQPMHNIRHHSAEPHPREGES